MPVAVCALALGALLVGGKTGQATAVAHGSASPTPTLTPGEGSCNLAGTTDVRPLTVVEGGEVGVTVGLAGDCPDGRGARADIFLLLDRSSSMADDGKLAAAHQAVREFVDRVDFRRHRVGLVTFNNEASVLQTLTDRQDRLLRALEQSGAPSSGTDIGEAIELTDSEFDASARPGAVRVMVLLTDGQSNVETMTAAALAARAKGTVIFTVALGPDADREALASVATSPAHTAYAPTPAELDAIYQSIAGVIESFAATDVLVHVALAPGTAYAAGSGIPYEPAGTRTLSWIVPVVTTSGLEMGFQARMSLVGLRAPATSAWAEYQDADDTRRRVELPAFALVEVRPSPAHPAYLPTLLQHHCLAGTGGVDVALAIDTSESMAGQKLADAVAGARSFLELLHPGVDQAAVIGYSEEARVAAPLSDDLASAGLALDTLASHPGTRLDRGLEAAAGEVLGPAHRAGSPAVVILLSDGRQENGPGKALAAADLARGAGVTVYTIALGGDADTDLMTAIAATPRHAYVAASPAHLADIYGQLSASIRCR